MKRTSIIIGILSSALALSACSTNKTPEPADNPQTSQEQNTTAKSTSALTPTPEQQKAAQELLNQAEAPQAPASSAGGTPQGAALQADSIPAIPEPALMNPTDALPVNLRGIRNPVPPEEAASSTDNAAPAPNAVELRGLRSPSMPKTLPLDITGKQTTGNAQ